MVKFHSRVAFLKAVNESFREGKITRNQQVALLAFGILPRHKDVREQVYHEMEAQLQFENLVKSDGTYSELDWASIIEMIKQYLPLILELLDAFTESN